ncbi:helix-turn-helix domain-containing protein [Mesorhizobium sp. M4B.F.Ca.ET.058.02.1.1]|uniref:helix-turn-helix domain-containing protein n=1 Tax=Mesorhizobium sp. M4B.F.Ca.ET.058.02.1.1 TaxID=2493675 RepID=UPI000F755835|nr:helix-turn-helix domain-containing protein [Mesorhizobium sp. M4B.F.Ca.ET.058.02.1.1]AZO48021.1 helix-turn-helix domain-containing protein [Mesorhizobium sp. M4B.F.Ca.ET.058.02.1.1]TJX67553.1 MAG: helix-turn-helix domain-containing protein [Mesorhizobium sp.]
MAAPKNPYRAPVLTSNPVIQELDRIVRASNREQREIMGKAGVTNPAYASWKRGDFEPTLSSLQAIAGALGYQVALIPKESADA